ncbi:MAG: ATP-binding cassette domain-containing protein [Chloroflexi bacterium]|nr:MAG: ATP-binding cassette domain-containing protein [Chloroflexota bacterium]
MAGRVGPALIRVDNLHYSYPAVIPGADPVPALRGIDLEIERGEFVAVMGPTGAGKTTLCLAISGLVPHATGGVIRGDVWVAGRNTKQCSVADLATQIGLVFQDSESQLFNMSVEQEVAFGPENLGLPVAEIEQRINWALEVVGLADLRHRSPAALSGGQQRRLAIASVLSMRPAVLVLDEPTAGLDPLGRQSVLSVVAALRQQGTTVIMATQDPDAIAALADRVIVLDEGRLVLAGTPRAVFSEVERMHALGLEVPQATEIGWRLGWKPLPLTLEEAEKRMARTLLQGGGRAGDLLSSVQESPSVPSGSPSVHVVDLWYRYDGVQALAGATCSLEQGDFVALIGANGSGKTTLAKHLNGLLLPQRGRVVVLGNDTRSVPAGVLAQQVGYVFQNPDHQIFAPSVYEEVAFGPRNAGLPASEVEARVADALAAFDLTDLAPVPPATLGYGTRRLVALASVHAMRPQVLIMDEATVGLDRRLALRLMEWVKELRHHDITILMITHNMRLVADYAERCLVMQAGQVKANAEPAAVFADHGMLASAGLKPPPVFELGLRLGWSAPPLTVAEFCKLYAGALNPESLATT